MVDHSSSLTAPLAGEEFSTASEKFVEEPKEFTESEATIRQLSSIVVTSALFVDALLYSLPISFLPVLLSDSGRSDLEIGLLFGSKPAVQILLTPIVGFITNRLGPRLPLVISTGFVVISTMLFGFTSVSDYSTLCAARALQGVGSAAAFSAGMAHLAEIFTTDEERGVAMGNALAGIGLAIIVAPPLGAIIYHYSSFCVPFFCLAGLAGLQLLLLIYCFFFNPHLSSFSSSLQSKIRPPYFHQIAPLADPLIIILLLLYSLLNGSVAMLEFLLPIYVRDRYNSSTLILGALFLPSTLGYIVFTPLSGKFGKSWGRILTMAIGYLFGALVMGLIGLPDELYGIFIIISGLGLSFGLVDGCLPTVLANLIDLRHGRHIGYGIVFAGSDAAISFGLLFGSFSGSALANEWDFQWATRIWALAYLCFIPLMIFVVPYEKLLKQKELEDLRLKQQEENEKNPEIESDRVERWEENDSLEDSLREDGGKAEFSTTRVSISSPKNLQF